MVFKKRLKRSFLKVAIMSAIVSGICTAYSNTDLLHKENIDENDKKCIEIENIVRDSKSKDTLPEEEIRREEDDLDGLVAYENNLTYEIYKSTTSDLSNEVDIMISFDEPISYTNQNGWSLSEDGTMLMKTFLKNEKERLEIRSSDGSRLVYVDVEIDNIDEPAEKVEIEQKYSTEFEESSDLTVFNTSNKIHEYSNYLMYDEKSHLKDSLNIECFNNTNKNASSKVNRLSVAKLEYWYEHKIIPKGKEDG